MFNFIPEMIPDLENYLDLYYHKILKVNLTDDSYEIIKMPDFENTNFTKLSEWLEDFCNKHVHSLDKQMFLEKTKLENLRRSAENEPLSFTYKREFSQGRFFLTNFILLPSVSYEPNNEICYLFIKNIDLPE